MRVCAVLAALVAAKQSCKGLEPGAGATDAWCNANCNANPPNCPPALCDCSAGPSPGPTPPPAPPAPAVNKSDPYVGGYLLLSRTDGLKKLQALADNAETIPITRLWLAFLSPNMIYEAGSKTLAQVGFGIPTTAADAGFAAVAAAVTKLTAGGVETYISMGGWNYNCFSYFYAHYSVAGYGPHSPNYWKINRYAGGNVNNCSKADQYCWVCEPKSESTSLDLSFAIFPEPANSSSWKAAQEYVQKGAKNDPKPIWHSYMMPGKMVFDNNTKQNTTVPGNAAWAAAGRDPYEDFVLLAKDLGVTGVDIDYEEMWHADYFKVATGGSLTGPWTMPHTAYKYAAIVKDVLLGVAAHAPALKVSTTPGAMGAWATPWWGGNLKGMWTIVQKKFPELISTMAKGSNAGGLNVMTYDVSSNTKYHECTRDNGMSGCALEEQVEFYMKTFSNESMPANVGYEVGRPAYPDYSADASHQLPLTKDKLATIIENTQGNYGGGFLWEMYKETMADDQASATEVAQAICKKVLPSSKRCSGVIPPVGKQAEALLV